MIPFYEHKKTKFQIFSGDNIVFRPHLHSGVELFYVKKGEIKAQYHDIQTSVKEGELLIVFPNTVHSYLGAVGDSEFVGYIYNGKMCDEIQSILEHKHAKSPLVTNLSNELIFTLTTLSNYKKNNDDDLVVRLYFELILAKVLPSLELHSNKDDFPSDLLSAVLDFINTNITETMSLSVIAKNFGVSRYKISRLFTHNVGISFCDYINNLRVDKAKLMLKSDQSNVIDVAFACGFESQQTFNRVFKKATNMTPKDYKKI